MAVPRTTRSNGRASRRQILDAATGLAAERGYEGTSISAVSERSGLPASSIYWHFANKDALFAAMIEDSYEQWVELLDQPSTAGETAFERTYNSLAACPDFVRLGLMLTLEQVPSGGRSARQRFLEIRQDSLERLRAMLVRDHPGLDDDQVAELAAVTLAIIDGTFVASVAGEAPVPPSMLTAVVGWLGAGAVNQARRHPTV